MKLYKKLKDHQNIEVPWHVGTCFGSASKEILVAGDQASFGEDFKELPELRRAIEFYVDQLGGKVKWSK